MARFACVLTTVAVMCAAPAFAQQYDLVINNGRVMDPETMYDSIVNVGIKDGRIQAVKKQKITGKETIDATGLVVAPGFIDTHFHSVDVFATKMAVRDGVTTGMDLEQGAARVGEWYALKEKEGWQINFGTTSSLLFTRLIVHDPEVKFDGPADMVNGAIVVKNNEVLPVKPGKPIRLPVEDKGRFVPVNVTEWLDEYTIPVETMHFDDTGAGDVLGEIS